MLRILAILLVLAGCAAQRAPVSDAEARRFAAALDARTARITAGAATYTATSQVEWLRGRAYLRTVIRGDSRDHIGDAVNQVFHEARQVGKDLSVSCETNGAFDQAVVSWNGRQIECRMLTVGF
jgi:hypothetical protein